MKFTGAPSSEIDEAYRKAMEIDPEERRFKDWYESWKSRGGRRGRKGRKR